MESQDQPITTDYSITNISKKYLLETAKWGKFLGVVGFVCCGIMAVLSLFMGTLFSSIQHSSSMPFGGAFIGGIYLVLAFIYFFPVLYLYKFSINLKSSVHAEDTVAMELAFKNQKSLFKFMGVFTIITIGLYILVFVGGFLGGMLS